MHADIYKGSKVCNVGYDTCAHHARLKVRDLVDIITISDYLELRARISPWFFKFLNNVVEGEFTQRVLKLGVLL